MQADLSQKTKNKMAINIIGDFFIGLIPFLGDLMDAAFKCNTRNAVLLEEELRDRGAKRLAAQGQAPGSIIDPSLGEEYDFEEEERSANRQHGAPPRYTSQREPSRPHRDVERAQDMPPAQPPRPNRVR